MSVVVPIEAISNQSLSIQLDDKRYDLRLRDLGDMMAIDISIDDQIVLQGHRVVGGLPIIPYKYLEDDGGNFIFLTELGDIPYWDQFGSTQSLIYFTPEELDDIRESSEPTVTKVNTPILSMPLESDFSFTEGNGPAVDSRATTATYVDNDVLEYAAIDEPRFEDGWYLHEGPSENLLTYSKDFDNAAWDILVNVSRTGGVADPWGGSTAFTLTATGSSAVFGRTQTGTIGVPYTYGIWIRRRTGSGTIQMTVGDNVPQTISITTEWQRVPVSDVPASTIIRSYVLITDSGDEVDIWGGQLEKLPVMSSYMPTLASTVPRDTDILNIPYTGNIPDIGQPMTVIVDIKYLGQQSTDQIIWQVVGESDRLLQIPSSSDATQGLYGSGSDSVDTTENTDHRIGFMYDGDNVDVSVDGAFSGSPGIATNPTGSATSISIGGDSFYGHIKRIKIYDQNLKEIISFL